MLFCLIFGVFLTQCSVVKSLFILEDSGERPIKNDQDFIKRIHRIEKRDLFGVETFPLSARVQSKDKTVIIVPNEGSNYPYNSYPSNPIPRYGVNGGNRGTTVVVMTPDNSYSNRYRG